MLKNWQLYIWHASGQALTGTVGHEWKSCMLTHGLRTWNSRTSVYWPPTASSRTAVSTGVSLPPGTSARSILQLCIISLLHPQEPRPLARQCVLIKHYSSVTSTALLSHNSALRPSATATCMPRQESQQGHHNLSLTDEPTEWGHGQANTLSPISFGSESCHSPNMRMSMHEVQSSVLAHGAAVVK